jgi:large subunit ribosomal protein L24
MQRVRRDDQVQVISGKDAGKSGRVLAVWPRDDRVLVEGI